MATPDSFPAWPPPATVVEAAAAGDEQALRQILVAGLPKLIAFFRGLGLSPHDSEDLASEASLAVVRSLARLRETARFEPWFWRVARSKFYDHLREKNRRVAPPERDISLADPLEAVLISAEHAAVRVAFQGLSERDRELLWMRDVIGLEYEDMAQRLPLREGAIRIAVMRARRRLESAFGLVLPEEELRSTPQRQ